MTGIRKYTQEQLKKTLWSAADSSRGTVDGGVYKDYALYGQERPRFPFPPRLTPTSDLLSICLSPLPQPDPVGFLGGHPAYCLKIIAQKIRLDNNLCIVSHM